MSAARPSGAPDLAGAPRSELNQRQEQIIALVRERGFVAIEALADHFDVTPQTIRRDINQLCDLGLLRRYHGGAGLPSSVEHLAYQTRPEIGRAPGRGRVCQYVYLSVVAVSLKKKNKK